MERRGNDGWQEDETAHENDRRVESNAAGSNNSHSLSGGNTAENTLYTVGEVCSLVKTTRKTLFYYDRIGLLEPTQRIGQQNVKMYDAGKVQRLRKILEYRDAGLRINEIRELMDDSDADRIIILQGAMKRLQTEHKDIDERIRKLQTMLEVEVRM